MKIKFLREHAQGDWVTENKFNPVRAERNKRQGIIEISQNTWPGVLTGLNEVFYSNVYPVTAVVYGPYPFRD